MQERKADVACHPELRALLDRVDAKVAETCSLALKEVSDSLALVDSSLAQGEADGSNECQTEDSERHIEIFEKNQLKRLFQGLLEAENLAQKEHSAASVGPLVDISQVMIRGKTPLMYYSSMYDEEMATLLACKGIELNESEQFGYTALHFAAQSDSTVLARALVAAGANPESKTLDFQLQFGAVEPGGKTALHLAAKKGYDNLVDVLVASGADINAVDLDGNTPYIEACMGKQWKTAEKLKRYAKDSSCSPPTEDWLQEKAKKDIAAARARLESENDPPSHLHETYVISEVFSQEQTETILRAVDDSVKRFGWTKTRHSAYATTDIPCYMVSSVFPLVKQRIQSFAFPQIASKYLLDPNKQKLAFRDLFYVKYEASSTPGGSQSGLAMHRDGSVLSFNILLNDSSDFEGGGTFIEKYDKVFKIERGELLVHSGRLRHAGVEITKGIRMILVAFLDIKPI